MELDIKPIISKESNFFWLTVKDKWVDPCVRGTKIILIFFFNRKLHAQKKIGLAVFEYLSIEDSAYFQSPAVEMYQLIGPLEIFQLTHQINLLFLLKQL